MNPSYFNFPDSGTEGGGDEHEADHAELGLRHIEVAEPHFACKNHNLFTSVNLEITSVDFEMTNVDVEITSVDVFNVFLVLLILFVLVVLRLLSCLTCIKLV